LEDFVMRGFLMNELERLKASLPIQMAASSSVYALCHTVWAFSALSFALNLFFGFLLSGLFAYGKRSLTPVMVGHGLAMIIAEPFLTLQMLEIMKLSQSLNTLSIGNTA
jgi:membrane protease YdiL (CAAX protease family)